MNTTRTSLRGGVLGRPLSAAALALLALAASRQPELFQLDRAALTGGELWRLWTCHLVHGSSGHYAYDVGAAALLIVLFGMGRSLLWMTPIVSLFILGLFPAVDTYYGLSGVLHGMVVIAAARMARQEHGLAAVLAGLFLAGTIAKASIETATGAAIFTSGVDMGGPVLHGSHLAGCLVGILALPVTLGTYGQYVTRKPSERLNPVPIAAKSRYSA